MNEILETIFWCLIAGIVMAALVAGFEVIKDEMRLARYKRELKQSEREEYCTYPHHGSHSHFIDDTGKMCTICEKKIDKNLSESVDFRSNYIDTV